MHSMAARGSKSEGCISSPYVYLQEQPQFSTFLRNADQLGAALYWVPL
jgi:hypothetical protein